MRSVEALIRWNHPTRGAVLPGEFIPIAEESGLILEIGDWVIREACRQASEWQRQGMPFLRVAVNVSPLQFRQANFVKKLSAALKEFSLEATFLEIELTEATLMSNAESSVTLLNELSQLGVVVAVDDFGTGYSSMSYLQRFPIDKLKIDRSFISDVASNAGDASIVRAIISLAHGLRLKVIAEGVESEQQLGILRRMGCDQYQGFYRSAAVPASDIERFARRDQRLRHVPEFRGAGAAAAGRCDGDLVCGAADHRGVRRVLPRRAARTVCPVAPPVADRRSAHGRDGASCVA